MMSSTVLIRILKHFVWYLEKEKRCDIETLAIDAVLNKEHFYGKSCRKCAPKASLRPLFHSGKQPKTAIACKKLFLKLDNLTEDYQKPLKKETLFYISNPVPLQVIKQVHQNFFISYILSD